VPQRLRVAAPCEDDGDCGSGSVSEWQGPVDLDAALDWFNDSVDPCAVASTAPAAPPS
jgi:hypothetical protein